MTLLSCDNLHDIEVYKINSYKWNELPHIEGTIIIMVLVFCLGISIGFFFTNVIQNKLLQHLVVQTFLNEILCRRWPIDTQFSIDCTLWHVFDKNNKFIDVVWSWPVWPTRTKDLTKQTSPKPLNCYSLCKQLLPIAVWLPSALAFWLSSVRAVWRPSARSVQINSCKFNQGL